MAKLFGKAPDGNQPSKRDLLVAKYRSARSVFLLVIVMTLVNMVMSICGQDTYFLFSIYVPYYLTFIGALLCGKMPDIYYEGEFAVQTLEGDTVMWVLAAVSLIIVAVAFVLWLISKKPGTVKMIIILTFFTVDTLAMILLVGIDISMILDYVMHAYIIYALITGITSAMKLNDLKNEPENIIVDDFTDVSR